MLFAGAILLGLTGCQKETLVAAAPMYLSMEQMENAINETVFFIWNEKLLHPDIPEEVEEVYEPEQKKIWIADLDEAGQAFARTVIEQINSGNYDVSYKDKILAGNDVEEAIINEMTPMANVLEERYGLVIDGQAPKLIEMHWNNDVYATISQPAVELLQERERQAMNIQAWMNDILMKIPVGSTQKDAYQIIHDGVDQTFTYDISKLDTPLAQNLNERRAVCEGYARAVKLLCDAYGIPAVVVHGNSSDGAHIWNEVMIDGVWYSSDPTWDDQNDVQSHKWMLVDPAQFSGHEVWTKEEL